LQSSITNKEEHHGASDLVTGTISNLDLSDEQTAVLESTSNLPDKPVDDAQPPEGVDNDKAQQTFIETVKEVADNIDKKTVPTTEQVIQISEQPAVSKYPEYINHDQVNATEFDRQTSTHRSSIIEQKQPNEFEKKSSCQQLQVINDEHPWYLSYYSIVDAEAKLARVYEQLNLAIEQPSSPITVKFQTQLQDKQVKHDDEIHITQHQKHIPLSITHEKTPQSTIITTELAFSPDIAVESTTFGKHSNTSITVPPIVSQTTNTSNKKKHKKKKKDSKEVTLPDTFQPKIETEQSYIKEQIDQAKPEIKQHLEQLYPISDTTSIISNTENLKQTDDKKNQSTSSNTPQLLFISTPTLQTDDQSKNQPIELQSTNKEPISQSSIKSTTNTSRTKLITPLAKEKEEEEEDNDGFQLVNYRKGILSTARPEKIPAAPATTSKDIFSCNTDPKISVTRDDESLPASTPADIQSTTSKKKKNRHKKHKKETVPSSTIDWTKIEQQSTDQETISQSQIPSSSVIENSNVLTIPTIKKTAISTKLSASPEEEEDEDNEGFQIVRYRRRITSAPRSGTTASSSSSAKTTYKQNVTRTAGLTSVVLHGRRSLTSRSIPRPTTIIGSSNKNQQFKPKQNKKQTSLFHTLTRSTSIDADNSLKTPKDNSQETKQLHSNKHETILAAQPKLDQSSPAEQSTKPIVKEHDVSIKNEATAIDQQSSVDIIAPFLECTINNADALSLTSTKDDDQVDSSISTSVPTTADPQPTTSKATSKKSKMTKENPLSPLTTDIDFIPLSVEETTDKKVTDHMQHVPETPFLATSSSSNSNETTSSSTTNKASTPETNEPMHQIYDTQNSFTSSAMTKEELSLSTAEQLLSTSFSQASSTNIPSTINQIDEVMTNESLLSPSFEPILKTEDEQTIITPTKKAAKRRKKKLRPEEKLDDKGVSTSSAITAATSHNIIGSNAQTPDDNNLKSARTSTQSFSSPSTTSETSSIKGLKSQQTTTDQITKSVLLSSPNIEPAKLSSSLPSQSIHFTEEANSKLDLFLPDYIRQQINNSSTISSSTTDSTDSSNTTPTKTSSSTIHRKKQRPKMLNKDYEAKSLLTNEFDHTTDTGNPHKQETVSTDDDNINDDDEFTIQTFHSNSLDKSDETNDNIVSRGFYLWLQESQALSKQQDKSSSSNNLTHAMQSIVIQPIESNDEDEDSWNASQAIKPTFMMGTRTEKRIHMTNAYLINHPESFSIPSWLTTQSNDNTFRDDSRKSDSTDEETSSKKQSSHRTNTQSSSNNQQQQTSFTTDDVQQCLDEDFYHQLDNDHPSMNFDDWAHFLEHKNSYEDLSPSLECFYTQTFNEDTLVSNTIPIHHSINSERQRYGDFLLSNNDLIIPESKISISSYKFKPSKYFQNRRKQELTYENDDEICISHSNNGLSRRIDL
jgi:hypothetical protein